MRCNASRAAVAAQFDQSRAEIAAAPARLIAPLPDSRLAPPRANRNNAFAQILEAYESGKLKSVSAAKTAERAAQKNQLVEVVMLKRWACWISGSARLGLYRLLQPAAGRAADRLLQIPRSLKASSTRRMPNTTAYVAISHIKASAPAPG